MNPILSLTPNGTLIRVTVQTRASRTEITGLHGEPPRLKIRLAAPPVDGEANEELIQFLSKILGIPKSKLTLIRGIQSKQKDVLCVGQTVEAIQKKITPHL